MLCIWHESCLNNLSNFLTSNFLNVPDAFECHNHSILKRSRSPHYTTSGTWHARNVFFAEKWFINLFHKYWRRWALQVDVYQLLLACIKCVFNTTALQTTQLMSHGIVSKHRDRIFGAFLSTNRHEHFLSDWQIVWDTTRTNFFNSQMFMQYWMYAGNTNA